MTHPHNFLSIAWHVFVVLVATLLGVFAEAVELQDPIQVTEAFSKIELARNTQGSLAVDAEGQAHLVYQLPGAGNPPVNQLLYQTIENGQPSEPLRIDSNSLDALHPFMILDPQQTAHVVWQDRRESTPAGNFFDNVEIFYDKKDRGEAFLDQDIRITNTDAAHLGDNGFLPQILQTQDRRLHIVWYDFNQDGSVADVYLRRSSQDGRFPPKKGIEDYQISFAEERGGLSAWMPAMAELMDNAIYVVWGVREEFNGPFTLQGRTVQADGRISSVETLTESGANFFDPPRLASDPQGNAGLVYTTTRQGTSRIAFQYKPAGQPWSDPILISRENYRASQPDIAFDALGQAWVVWLLDSGEGMLAQIDPQAMQIAQRQAFAAFPAWVLTPSIAVAPQSGQLHIAWVDQREIDTQAIYYTRSRTTAVRQWRQHSP